MPQRRVGNFLPLGYAHSSRGKKAAHPPSSTVFRLASECVVNRPRPFDRHRGRDGRGLERQQETHHGDHRQLQEDRQRLHRLDHHPKPSGQERPHHPEETRSNDNAPSHRVFVGKVEIGAAWAKRSNEGRDYLGLKLDDPSFTAPIFANLFDDEGSDTYSLIWSRPNKRNGD